MRPPPPLLLLLLAIPDSRLRGGSPRGTALAACDEATPPLSSAGPLPPDPATAASSPVLAGERSLLLLLPLPPPGVELKPPSPRPLLSARPLLALLLAPPLPSAGDSHAWSSRWSAPVVAKSARGAGTDIRPLAPNAAETVAVARAVAARSATRRSVRTHSAAAPLSKMMSCTMSSVHAE